MIGWSGTAAGWMGFEGDEKLCEAITKATGIPATTSVLALNKALDIFKVKKLGLVTPYLDDVQESIMKNYNAIGIEITSETERHLRIVKNSDIALVGQDVLETAAVVRFGPVQRVFNKNREPDQWSGLAKSSNPEPDH
ncbi:hypothetical protein BDR04DRAFT_1162960 [Suillus decipiens]|nr:hypothetical protein BDR04DRAFT_1162960 [Suillus decipiens]